MTWLFEFLRRLRFRLQGSRFDRDLADEMRLHLELRAARRQAEGLAGAEAHAAARRAFGNATRLQESSREAWGWTFLDRLGQDLRYGFRSLASQPGFTLTALLSLWLGIGANTAIFSIVNAVLLRSLPVADPAALVQIKLGTGPDDEINTPIWEEIRDRQRSFSGVLAWSPDRFNVSLSGEKRRAQGLWVSGEFFPVLGVPPYMGRTFTASDERWGGSPEGALAVISYDFWKSYYNGRTDVVGQSLPLNRRRFTVIGVTPPWFRGLDVDHGFDIAIPLGSQPLLQSAARPADEINHWWLRILGRLSPGAGIRQAEDSMAAMSLDILRATVPPGFNSDMQAQYLKGKFNLRPAGLGFSQVRGQYRTALLTLMTIVGLVLLIACANLANLLSARGAARRRELSVRMAIGAGRARVIRQLMTESLLLAGLGAAGGFLFALWGGRTLVRLLATPRNPIDIGIYPDLSLLGFTALVSLVTALLFGLAPAFRATRIDLQSALKDSARRTPAAIFSLPLGRLLVAAQVALSMLLLVGAGLFLTTLRNLLSVDTGFDRRNVLLMNVDLTDNVRPESRAQAWHDLLARVRAVPGVASAAHSVLTPINPEGWAQPVYPEGFSPKSRRDSILFLNSVSPGYFQTLRTPVLMGRDFNDRDTLAAPGVIVINETAARAFFDNVHPVGKTIGLDKPGKRELYQVVGVVKDTKYNRIDEQPRRIGYLSAAQESPAPPSLRFAIRSDKNVLALIPSLQSAVAASPDSYVEFRSLDGQVNDSLLRPRLVALLSGIFGALALVLATVGLYGITSYSVARRSSEIGIRIALGAPRAAVIRLMMRDVAALLALGMVAGWLASLALGRLVDSLLFGLRANAPVQVLAAGAILAAATALAGYLPARRAARLEPMSALRQN